MLESSCSDIEIKPIKLKVTIAQEISTLKTYLEKGGSPFFSCSSCYPSSLQVRVDLNGGIRGAGVSGHRSWSLRASPLYPANDEDC